MSTADTQTFLDATLPAQIDAERSLHHGDITPRLSTWSHGEDVTLFGAGAPFRAGWRDVLPVFEWLGRTFVSCDRYEFELLASDVSGDLAYTVGLERYRATTAAGETVENTLRATHVYRREEDGWKIVHRHGDHVPADVTGTKS